MIKYVIYLIEIITFGYLYFIVLCCVVLCCVVLLYHNPLLICLIIIILYFRRPLFICSVDTVLCDGYYDYNKYNGRITNYLGVDATNRVAGGSNPLGLIYISGYRLMVGLLASN